MITLLWSFNRLNIRRLKVEFLACTSVLAFREHPLFGAIPLNPGFDKCIAWRCEALIPFYTIHLLCDTAVTLALVILRTRVKMNRHALAATGSAFLKYGRVKARGSSILSTAFFGLFISCVIGFVAFTFSLGMGPAYKVNGKCLVEHSGRSKLAGFKR